MLSSEDLSQMQIYLLLYHLKPHLLKGTAQKLHSFRLGNLLALILSCFLIVWVLLPRRISIAEVEFERLLWKFSSTSVLECYPTVLFRCFQPVVTQWVALPNRSSFILKQYWCNIKVIKSILEKVKHSLIFHQCLSVFFHVRNRVQHITWREAPRVN